MALAYRHLPMTSRCMHLLSPRTQLVIASHPSLGGWNHVWTTVGWKLIQERQSQCWFLCQDHEFQQLISGSILMALKWNLLSELTCSGSLSMTPSPGLITSTLFAAKLAERLERLDGRFICWPPMPGEHFLYQWFSLTWNMPLWLLRQAWTPVWEIAFKLFGRKQSVAQPVLDIKMKYPSPQSVPAYQHCWSMDHTICLFCSPMCETRSSAYVMCETPTASSPPSHQRTGEFLSSVPGDQSCWSCIFFEPCYNSLELLSCWLLTFSCCFWSGDCKLLSQFTHKQSACWSANSSKRHWTNERLLLLCTTKLLLLHTGYTSTGSTLTGDTCYTFRLFKKKKIIAPTIEAIYPIL